MLKRAFSSLHPRRAASSFNATRSRPPLPSERKLSEQKTDMAAVARMLHEVGDDKVEDKLLIETVKERRIAPFHSSWNPFKAQTEFVRPHDLSRKARERKNKPLRDWKLPFGRKECEMKDPFWQLDIDPIAFATNPKVLGGYLTQMGLIKQRTETGLTFRSQRRLAKAIKRARMMGVIPVFSKPGSEIKMATLKDTRGNRPSF